MKVLYILHSTIMGGATISFLNLLFEAKESGVCPVVVIPSNKASDPGFEQLLTKEHIEYHKVPIVSSTTQEQKSFFHWLKQALRLVLEKSKSRKELYKVVAQVNPDIIHTNVGVVHEGFHVAKKLKKPHVWHLREYQTKDFNYRIFPSFDRFCSYLKRSSVICISEGIRSYFRLGNVACARTIYNGIFHEEEVRFDKEKEPFFLMASRVSPEKGHLEVVRAFGLFSRNKGYRLKIAGFGDEGFLQEIRNEAEKHGCGDRIDFLGHQKDVRPLMAKAKALIVASYYEAFGRMTAEASFCGTLVIGRKTAGTEEILSKTGGFFFNTPEELARQMEAVDSLSEEEYAQRALKAQKIAVENYSIESNIEKTCNLYSEILKEKSAT